MAKKEKAPAVPQGPTMAEIGYVPSLQKKYKEEIVDKLMKEFKYSTVMQVPKLTKITVNQGIGSATQDKKLVEVAQQELTTITGQKAVQTVSRKDISNFKLRKGMPIGVKVTLRGVRMYEFLERLVAVSLPRIRDFKGVSENFDGRGNYTMGVKEQIIFPEIDIDKITKVMGMEITFVTTATRDEEAFALLREFGIPFVAGIPAECTEDHYFQAVQEAVETGENQFPFRNRSYPAAHADVVDPGCMPVCLIGEPVIMTSLAASAELLTGAETHVFGATEDAQIFLGDKDAALSGEEELEEALRKVIGQVRIQDSSIEVPSSNSETTHAAQEKRGEKVPDCVRVVADPYYRFVFPDGCGLIPLPHLAFSGRIFLNEIPDLIRFSW